MRSGLIVLLVLVALGCFGYYYIVNFDLLGEPVRQDLAIVRIPSTNCEAIVTSVRTGATDVDYIQVSKDCDGDRTVITRIFKFDSVGHIGLKGDSLFLEAMSTAPDTNGRTVYAVKIR